MRLYLSAVHLLCGSLFVAGIETTFAQDYPTKPIRIMSPEVGGGGDFVARLIAQDLTADLKQQVIIDNRGFVAGEIVAKAPPDGYTLLIYSNAIWLSQFLRDNVPWDAAKDFFPVTALVSTPNVLAIHPSLPVKSVKDLIALAKARPGELNYASTSAGSSPHLSAELFNAMAGVNIVRIPYKGSGPAINALIGGQVQLSFAIASSVMPQVKSGRLRALATTSAQPSALLPGMPTLAASGLPGYESTQTIGVFAPAKTPAAVVNRLQRGIAQALARTEVRERLLNAGAEPVGSTPEEFAALISTDTIKWGKLIKDKGIREQ